LRKKGFLVTIAAPSGGGKSTIVERLLTMDQDFCYSISWTTRQIRGSEVHGRDYFFTDMPTFERMISQGYFLEYAKVHGNYYGTSTEYIDKSLCEKKIILLDIDVQGVRLVQQKDYNVVTIFVLPPSEQILIKRLTARGTETQTQIETRLQTAKSETEYLRDYEYLVINDDLQSAVSEVYHILTAERNKLTRYIDPIADYYQT
jgi:guanylate kinase